jgi:hypothetical protein
LSNVADNIQKSFIFMVKNRRNIPERRFAVKSDWALRSPIKFVPGLTLNFGRDLAVSDDFNGTLQGFGCIGRHSDIESVWISVCHGFKTYPNHRNRRF